MPSSETPRRASVLVRRLAMAAYAALFCIALPALLAWWAAATSDDVTVRLPGPPVVGLAPAAVGAALMIAGTAALWKHGGGVPMNAFPPPRLVTAGIYSFVPHPIYVGFSLVVAGVAIVGHSASGFWLVAPTVALGCAALTLGYEAPDLHARFPAKGTRAPGWLPDDSSARPSWTDRLRCWLFLLLPWVVCYEIVISPGVPHDAFDVQLPFERRLPIIGATEVFYATPYLVAGLAPLVAPTRAALRRFMIRGWIATALIMPVYLAIPTLAPRRPFVADSPVAALLAWERDAYTPVAAFPSFHVVWAMLLAALLSEPSGAAEAPTPRRRRRLLPVITWTWAAAVAASCVTTGMHAIADVVAGVLAGAILLRIDRVWDLLRRTTERLANSWHEWRWGPVRLINHGVYAGLGTFACLTAVGVLLGPGHAALVLTCATAAVIGAAAWAQWIEGSPRLQRPYGFYGGVAGIALASLAAPAFGVSPWLVLAAFSVGSPLAQSLGRLRCLVQGCCHGRPTSGHVGIRYTHPRSRVCRLSEYAGLPVHATPLYSILWNGFVLLVVGRLWTIGAPLHLIAGVCAIATGIGRFAEEAYRGEPQTPVVAGLRLYQWVAVASVLGGILMSALGRGGPAPTLQWNWTAPLLGAVFGLITTVAFGVDFPDSNRRFARLA